MTWGDPVRKGLPGKRHLTKLLMLVQNIGGGGQNSLVIRLLGRVDVKLDNSTAWDRHLNMTLQTARVKSATTTSTVA